MTHHAPTSAGTPILRPTDRLLITSASRARPRDNSNTTQHRRHPPKHQYACPATAYISPKRTLFHDTWNVHTRLGLLRSHINSVDFKHRSGIRVAFRGLSCDKPEMRAVLGALVQATGQCYYILYADIHRARRRYVGPAIWGAG